MEVHHHPQLHHKEKPWKEYLLECLMIFVAVSMGFIAENIREYLLHKEHEHKYIESFYDDLKTDSTDLQDLISSIQLQQLVPSRSLPSLFSSINDLKKPADSIYIYLRKCIRQRGIKAFVTDRTYEQIKNAGEMRLISQKQIADSLIDYYKEVILVDYLQQTLLVYKEKLRDDLPLILNHEAYEKVMTQTNTLVLPPEHLYLISNEPMIVNRILIQVNEIEALSLSITKSINRIMDKNMAIRKLMEENYHIEN